MTEITKMPISPHFCKPIDYDDTSSKLFASFGLRPSSIGAIKKKLTTNEYLSPEGIFEDFKVLFSDYITVYGESHEIGAMASDMLKITIKMFKNVPKYSNNEWYASLLYSMKKLEKTLTVSPPVLKPDPMSPYPEEYSEDTIGSTKAEMISEIIDNNYSNNLREVWPFLKEDQRLRVLEIIRGE